MKIEFKPTFIQTQNVRNFEVIMDALELSEGEGRLGLVYGRAGRGKSRTSQWYTAHNGCVYLRMATVWHNSELYFLTALCREVGIMTPPARKGPCYEAVIDALAADPRPVFLDEPEKMTRRFLDVIRDLSDESTAPFVLIGEEELVSYMRINRRVWSRTFQQLEFKPIDNADIISYAMATTGLELSAETAGVLHAASGGDLRIVRREIISLVQIANARQTVEIDAGMAKMAVRAGLKG